MRGVFKLLLVLVPVSLIAGLAIVGIVTVRNRANAARCQSNLKQIGMALQDYQACLKRLPSGTVPNPELSPDQRLSWMTAIWPTFMEGGIAMKFDKSKAWNAEENCPVTYGVKSIPEDGPIYYREWVLNDVRAFMCPSNSSRSDPGLLGPTHYVGIAGVGEDAAELPASDRRAGMFGYDRVVSLESISDGTSLTLLMAEVQDSRPWTAGW